MASSNNFLTNSDKVNMKKWRVFLIPYFARSHLIPMADFAGLLLAKHPDIELTMVITPGNTKFITSSLDKSNDSAQHPVQILTYPFPSIGLKPDVETVRMDNSAESSDIEASHMARPGLEQVLQQHKPDAVIADVTFSWIAAIAADFKIPCLFFSPLSSFSMLVLNCFQKMRVRPGLLDHVTVLGLPGPEIRMPVLELPPFVLEENNALNVESLYKAVLDAFGIVVNTCRGVELQYCNEFEKTEARRAYFVGPVSVSYTMYHGNIIERGGEGETSCLRWLDTKEERSVIFVSFGTQCYFKSAQLHELAMGLEGSRQNFLWVVRDSDQSDEWIPEGWEERIADRGFVVRGWAPQLAILAHAAIGAFVMQCGWNSILEATAAGVPMLTWPLAYEQFINEKLVVDVIGCAARLWEGGKRSTRETEKELVPRTVIAHALSRFMEPEGEFSSVHRKAQELGPVARSAMADGGSSMSDLSRLISDLITAMENKTCQ
ncbi:Glycosyltransferase [Rhynchospora pubera]|uniref:Glycosyltransferase n=1 Tax=Rhynchospora pubera TaxID=906938 RepID=A0AAV8G6B4_9POAL|nr:Glycosyltransferase [Rhynchospora pubera]